MPCGKIQNGAQRLLHFPLQGGTPLFHIQTSNAIKIRQTYQGAALLPKHATDLVLKLQFLVSVQGYIGGTR